MAKKAARGIANAGKPLKVHSSVSVNETVKNTTNKTIKHYQVRFFFK